MSTGRTTSAPPPIYSNAKLELNETERQIFDDLLQVAINKSAPTTLRAAGGWVRDKLMGHASLDIDIALDNQLGKDFAESVNEYLAAHHQETHKVAVIMSNPEQSKHLETARMRIRGIWLDLVNLRSEQYAKDSRIPSMSFGTPEQDAMRRDFTINALFYNINSGEVEDFTGKGIDDLKAGVIRTPLPPKETFLDDPLRVLRAVRFSARFGFQPEASLLEAAADDEVREALGHKVSRERIGAELEGMLKGPDPVGAIRLLDKLRLFEAVWGLESTAGFPADAATVLMETTHQLMNQLNSEDESERRQCLLAALLLPIRGIQISNAKGKPQPLYNHIIKDSLKWRSKDADAVDVLLSNVPSLLAALTNDNDGSSIRHNKSSGDIYSSLGSQKILLGRTIRRLKHLWKPALIIAALLEPHKDIPPDTIQPWLHLPSTPPDNDTIKRMLEKCKTWEAAVTAFGLDTCYEWKPMMDGKAVMTALGMKQGGPRLGALIDEVIDWQIMHPNGTMEQCRDWFVEKHSTGVEM